MSEHERIFLQPQDEADDYDGRQWCEDDGNWDNPGIAFVRADICEQWLSDARAAAYRAGKLEGLKMAREIAGQNAWKHYGDDDYSRGLDRGATSQTTAIINAIAARIAEIENEGKDDDHAK